MGVEPSAIRTSDTVVADLSGVHADEHDGVECVRIVRGLGYVALSRVRTRKGMWLLGLKEDSALAAPEAPNEEMHRLRKRTVSALDSGAFRFLPDDLIEVLRAPVLQAEDRHAALERLPQVYGKKGCR